jgi:tetratricopeptide (TPR) repeat protein
MPDDQAFVNKVQKLMALMEQGQSVLLGPRPELSVKTYQEILLLEPTEHNHYHMQAKKQIDLWTAPDQLAELYMKRGKEAELQQNYSEARDFFIKAQQLDEFSGTEELKAFEKKAYQHFNRAMGFAIKEDFSNVKIYLKKSLELIPKTSKLYDRIEGYARRNLKD